MDQKAQLQRFELKYFITEGQAVRIREIIRGYLVPDEFSLGRPDHAYPVHSLYIDSNDLATYWATVHCEKKRFKLRVRYYDGAPQSPLFFEIKRRENECVLKQRGVVRRSAGALLLAGQLPAPEHLAADTPESLGAVQRFCLLMQRLNARPTMAVTYLREAWVSPGGGAVRVTIDRDVRGEPRHEAAFDARMRRPVLPFGRRRVLELKFAGRFPDWFRQLAQHFGLRQTAVPKYCGSVAETGEDRAREQNPPGMQRGFSEEAIQSCLWMEGCPSRAAALDEGPPSYG